MTRFWIFLLFLIISGCQMNKKPSVEELFEVDKKFSLLSTEIGYNNAFIEFAHDDAVLLKKNSMPIEGKQSVINIYEKVSAEGVDFTWQPLNGKIAQSGELGYTYGTYKIKIDTLISVGTYVSIWKKDEQGNWKYILDSGNEGLGN